MPSHSDTTLVSDIMVPAATAASIMVIYVVLKTLIRKFRNTHLFSWFLYKTSTPLNYNIRAVFRKMDMPQPYSVPGHSHPEAAGARSVANIFIDNVIESCGYKPYSVSMSQRDVRANQDGTRHYFFGKDLPMDYRSDQLSNQHIMKMIDVDYYVDMPHLLRKCKPLLLYTMVPLEVSGYTPNGHYFITGDEVHMNISGGAYYQHKIWNYDTDNLILHYWWGSVVYLIETRMTDDQTRRIILLEPVRIVYGYMAWLLPSKTLARRVYSYAEYTINKFLKDGVLKVSFKREIDVQGATIPLTVATTALIRCSKAKDPSISDVERIFRSSDVSDPVFSSALFMLCLEGFNVNIKDFTTVPKYSIAGYQSLKPLVMEDGKSSARVIGPQYLLNGSCPVRSYNNDVACVEGRILKVKNPDKRPPPFYAQCRTEFINMLIPDDTMHVGVPLEENDVYKLQNRPSQRNQNALTKWFSFLQPTNVKSFQKAEIYGKITHPRNISTLNTDHRLRYSSFMYSLKNFIKMSPWYAFGHHPRVFVSRLREISTRAAFVVPTDFSKFDGTHGRFLADMEEMVLRRYFDPCYHNEVVKLHSSQFNVMATTKEGVRYDTGYSRLSGSSETSDFNTLCNAYVAYVALRHVIADPEEAYSSLGLYGGDDGLTANVEPALYTKVADRLGLKLKSDKIFPGNPVTFLGRTFPDIWSSSDSVCDVPRRVAGLHLTVTPSTVKPEHVLIRKAKGYLVTDMNTPFIANWAKAILRIYGSDDSKHPLLYLEDSWFSQYEQPFPQSPITDDPTWHLVASSLGISVKQLRDKSQLLDNAMYPGDLDVGLLNDNVPSVELDAAVGDKILIAAQPSQIIKKQPPRIAKSSGREYHATKTKTYAPSASTRTRDNNDRSSSNRSSTSPSTPRTNKQTTK